MFHLYNKDHNFLVQILFNQIGTSLLIGTFGETYSDPIMGFTVINNIPIASKIYD